MKVLIFFFGYSSLLSIIITNTFSSSCSIKIQKVTFMAINYEDSSQEPTNSSSSIDLVSPKPLSLYSTKSGIVDSIKMFSANLSTIQSVIRRQFQTRFASSLGASVASLKGQHFMSIDQLRYGNIIFDLKMVKDDLRKVPVRMSFCFSFPSSFQTCPCSYEEIHLFCL